MDIQHPLDADIYQVLTIPISDPMAGAPLSYTIPANVRLEILTFDFTFTSDANAANRILKIMGNDGVTTNPTLFSGIIQTANNAWTYHFGQGYQLTDLTANFDAVMQALPWGFALNSVNVLVAQPLNIQVGDTITDASIRVRRWIQP